MSNQYMSKIKSFQVEGLDVEDFKTLISETFKNLIKEHNETLRTGLDPPQNSKDLLTQKAAAELLNVSVQTLIKWRTQNLLKGHTKGRMVYYFLDEIHQAIREGNFKPKKKEARSCSTK